MCFNGKPLYEAFIAKKKGHAFFTPTDRHKFAEESIAALLTACPESLVSGLVRVDIMISNDNKMVVNEFESLEANHYHSDNTLKQFCHLNDSLTKYYADMLCTYANEIINERNLN